MGRVEHSSVETLFHHWRQGDETAGKQLAQRFTDWYYAIAVSRLGETGGDAAFRAATSKFGKGVMEVEDPRRLLAWAHSIARKQLTARVDGGRVTDGDLPNAFTRRKSPKELLVAARDRAPDAMAVLERAYRGDPVVVDPQRLLWARYQVKSTLRHDGELPLRVTPADPDPDRAPLPYYEAGRMASEAEESQFEQYLLTEPELCQDLAEFAHFAIALRGGLPGTPPALDSRAPAPRPVEIAAPPPEVVPTTAAPTERAPAAPTSNLPFLVVLVIAAAVVLGLIYLATQWNTSG